jgi:hypothetical protein
MDLPSPCRTHLIMVEDEPLEAKDGLFLRIYAEAL